MHTLWIGRLLKLWPFVVLGLLLYGANQMVKSHRQISEERTHLMDEVGELKETLREEAEVAEVVAEQAVVARTALKARDVEVNKLREEYDHIRKELQYIAKSAPAMDCIHQPVHPGLVRLLNSTEAKNRPAAASNAGT